MKSNIDKFSYLEFGRNKAIISGETTIQLSFSSLTDFSKLYNNFIKETEDDDNQNGILDEIFSKNNYPKWDEIIKNQLVSYLQVILNDYLFIEFFSKYLTHSSNFLITGVSRIELKNENLILRCPFCEK